MTQPRRRQRGGKAHGTAVALALILLFLGHDVLLIETKQEQNLS
jgi:hypothetical protein